MNPFFAGGLTYRNKVSAVRQTYYIYESESDFIVMSFSLTKPNTGNFNIVTKRSVKYVLKHFAGKSVTAKTVVKRAQRTEHAPDPLRALNILYVLDGIGMARHRVCGSHNELQFSIKSRR